MPAVNGWRSNMPSSLPSDVAPDDRLRLIVESYQRLTGKSLLPDDFSSLQTAEALRLALWEAPFAIVAHGTEEEPIFFYGNRVALELFEMSFAEFMRLPSHLSAEPAAQESRERALKMVAQQGFVDGYSGVRISSSGKRFRILNTTIWNLADAAGGFHGQAATFTDWQPL